MSSTSQGSLADSLAKFMRDVLKMGDLQLQLLSIDLRSLSQSARIGTMLALVGVALLFGALPVLLFGLAGVLHLLMQIPEEYAWLLVGSTSCALGLLTLRNAVVQLTRATKVMKRSQEEFHRNVEWVRGVLHQQ